MYRLAFLIVLALWTAPGGAPRAEDNPLNAVVEIRSTVPADARTADTLGTERAGGGILIDRGGLILTIGYLIMEADEIWVSDLAANRVPRRASDTTTRPGSAWSAPWGRWTPRRSGWGASPISRSATRCSRPRPAAPVRPC
jgi:hypothetical protein